MNPVVSQFLAPHRSSIERSNTAIPPTSTTAKVMGHPAPDTAIPPITSSIQPLGLGTQETASFLLQAAPYIQQTATSHRIGLPKPYSGLQHPVSLAQLTTGNSSRHYAELCRQQTKLARDGSIKLHGLFFLIRRGKETSAPTQVANMPYYTLSSPSHSCPVQISWTSSGFSTHHSH